MMQKKNNILIKAIIFVVAMSVLFVVVKSSGVNEYLSPDFAKEKIDGFGIWAPVAFIALFVLVTVTFLPATPLDFVAGALFGTAAGVLYVVIGASIGATLAFIFTRTFGKDFVQRLVESRLGSLRKYYNKTDKHGLKIMLFLRLIPIFPFNGLNFAMGLTKIKFRDYVVGTVIGIIPGTFSYVYFGDSLASANLLNIFLAIFFLIILSAIYPMYKKFRKLEKDEFDIIVIGAGSGGLNIAGFMNKAGFKTLLIDKTDENIGGDCLNFGCVPSKALIHVARTLKQAHNARKYGLISGGEVDFEKVKTHIKNAQNVIRVHEKASYFRKQGIEVKLGEAKFVSKNEIEVEGERFQGRKIVIATGSRPRMFKASGSEKVKMLNNETIFDVEKLPQKLLVIGGGPIGIELGQAFAQMGSVVSVVHRGDKCLGKERAEVSSVIHEQLEKDGVQMYFNSEIKAFTSSGDAMLIRNSKEEIPIQFDTVLVAIGRELNVEGLDLEKAGVELENGKIKVDDFLRTTNKRIYLAGDIAGGAMFTHAAELHASVILNNFFSPLKKKLSYGHFSWVTFTDPEVATFGLSQDQLERKGVEFSVLKKDFSDDDRAITDDYQKSLAFLFVGKNRKILGGSIVAPRAGEIVQELILAMSSGLKVDRIFSKIYSYPTAGRINKSVISQLFAKKLESKVNRKMLRFLYH